MYGQMATLMTLEFTTSKLTTQCEHTNTGERDMYGPVITITIRSAEFTTGKPSNASTCFTFFHGGGRGVGKGWVEGVGGVGGRSERAAPLSHLRR